MGEALPSLFDSLSPPPSAPPSAPPAPAPPPPPAATLEPRPPVTAAPPAVELSVAMREVLGFPMRLVPLLPVPTTLVVEVITTTRMKLFGQRVVLTTAREAYAAARKQGIPALHGREMTTLSLAVEHDRAGMPEIAAWLARKLSDPQFTIELAVAMGELAELPTPKSWSCERVFHELGLRLLEVTTGAEVPASLGGASQEQAQGRAERGAA